MTLPEGTRRQALDRIHQVYARRARVREEAESRDPDRQVRTDEIRRADYRRMFADAGFLPLGNRDVLDVGCQWGTWLAQCRQQWGQQEGLLCGIELMEHWAQKGRELYDFIDLRCGSGDRLPWEDETFDLVHQGMVLSSVLHTDLREGIAAEMRRVTRPGGCVVWYDFFFNPTNPETVGITASMVRGYFPGWEILWRQRVTLAPPLARLLRRVWGASVNLLGRLRVLNFHYLMLLRKPLRSAA
jgi:SAM-dependent methyltransferase